MGIKYAPRLHSYTPRFARITSTVTWAALGLPRPDAAASVRDVGARKDLGSFTAAFAALVPPHDAIFVRIEQA